jgi:hypothetical protein
MVLKNIFKKKFKGYIKNFLIKGYSKIAFSHAFEKNGFILVEVVYLSTLEKNKFLFKEFSWYCLPHMEEVSYKSELFDILNDIKNKWSKGFYEIDKLSNSLNYITSD